MFLSVLKTVAGPLATWLSHRQELKKIDKETELAVKQAESQSRIKRAEDGLSADIELDRISLQSRGWKDEYLLLVGTVPLILSFIPSMQIYVKIGFESLSKTPEWYWYLLGALFVDTLGFRSVLRGIIEVYIGKISKRKI